jgi:phytanoyl-CoA hydroxylase
MADLKAVSQHFHEDGFVIVRQVYLRDEIATLERRLEEFIRNTVPSLKPGEVYFEDTPSKAIKSIHRMESHSEHFRQLLEDARLVGIVQAIFPQGRVIQESAMFFAKAAGAGSETPAHQDNAFQHWNPPDALTLTLAVDESTPANGPLICLKGSHKLGVLPHRQSGVMGFSRTLIDAVDPEVYPKVALCMKPGDIALHHINTIHCSEPNSSSSHRRQIGMAYRSSTARRDEEGFQRYLRDLEQLHNQKATT